MKFFLDSANLESIQHYSTLGFIDGVTTNPSLIAKEHIHQSNIGYHIAQICEIVQGPISVEVYGLTADEMVKEGLEYVKIGKQIVVKVPATEQGLIACKQLSTLGIKVNVTLIFSPLQALVAAKMGATFVSPFIGRMEDSQLDGLRLVEEIKVIFDNNSFPTQILGSSFRSLNQVKEVACIGAHAATISPDILAKIFTNPLTEKGLNDFLATAHQ